MGGKVKSKLSPTFSSIIEMSTGLQGVDEEDSEHRVQNKLDRTNYYRE